MLLVSDFSRQTKFRCLLLCSKNWHQVKFLRINWIFDKVGKKALWPLIKQEFGKKTESTCVVYSSVAFVEFPFLFQVLHLNQSAYQRRRREDGPVRVVAMMGELGCKTNVKNSIRVCEMFKFGGVLRPQQERPRPCQRQCDYTKSRNTFFGLIRPLCFPKKVHG